MMKRFEKEIENVCRTDFNPAPIDFIREFYKKLIGHLAFRIEKKGENLILTKDLVQTIGQLCLWHWRHGDFNGNLNKGILLRSSVGVGKTMIMRAFIDTIKYEQRMNLPMIHSCELQSLYARGNDSEIDRLKRRTLIIIDDLGCEATDVKYFGTSISPFMDFYDYRYRNDKTTIITTNLLPTEIEAKYGARIIDRFREDLNDLIIDGKSFR